MKKTILVIAVVLNLVTASAFAINKCTVKYDREVGLCYFRINDYYYPGEKVYKGTTVNYVDQYGNWAQFTCGDHDSGWYLSAGAWGC